MVLSPGSTRLLEAGTYALLRRISPASPFPDGQLTLRALQEPLRYLVSLVSLEDSLSYRWTVTTYTVVVHVLFITKTQIRLTLPCKRNADYCAGRTVLKQHSLAAWSSFST